MKMRMNEIIGLSLAAMLMLAGCSEVTNPSVSITPQPSTAATTSSSDPSYVQIERLGRPAINEGLVITNDYLNAFNSISPSQD